jgi:hypothetical protein
LATLSTFPKFSREPKKPKEAPFSEKGAEIL